MQVEHELRDRSLKACERPLEHNKARPGQFCGAGKIHQPELFADRLMRQRIEIEARRLAVLAN